MIKLHLLYLIAPIITFASLFSETTKQIQSPLYASEVQMGKSVLSNSLFVYFLTKIPFKNVQEIYGKNAILINSYMHAREPYSLQLIQKLFQSIVQKSYENEIDYFIQNGVFIFYPFVNIDGFKSMSQKGYFNEGLRKNFNTKGVKCESGLAGVDINRNFPAKFGILKQSSFPCSQQYHGDSPFSEKEAIVFKELYDNFKILIAIDIHSYGNQWIYPYASDETSRRVKQNQVLYPFYEQLIEELTAKNRKIKGCKESLGYIADGVYIDWALDQGALSLAFEVGRTFHSDKRQEVQKAISLAIQDFYIVFAKTKPSYKIQKHLQTIQIKSLSLSNINMQIAQGQNVTVLSLKPRSSAQIPFDATNQKIFIKNVDTDKIDQVDLKNNPLSYFIRFSSYLFYLVPGFVLAIFFYVRMIKKSNQIREGAIQLQENTGSFSERSHQIQEEK